VSLNSTSALETANTLLGNFGSSIDILTVTQQYVVGVGFSDTETTVTVDADISAYESEEIRGQVLAGDLKVLIAGDKATPTIKDRVRFGGKNYSIVLISPQYLQDVIVYYMLTIRG